MAKNKVEESKAEKIKVKVGTPAPKSAASIPEGGHAKKTRDDLWNHPDLDGGFAEEMEHRPGDTVSPVDLAGPEQKPEKEAEGPPEERQEEPFESPPEKQTELQSEPETESEPEPEPEPETALPVEEEQSEAVEEKAEQSDAVYKSDEEFYSSKLDLDNAKGKSHKAAKKRSRPRKYLNPHFLFILMLFITTLAASFVMLAIIEQQHPGSSLLFDYIPLPEFVF